MTREEILQAAKKCVCGDREQDYGRPEDNFQRIAVLWNAYCGLTGMINGFEPKDVAIMMALVKIARIASGRFKADSYIDACGYMACGAEIDGGE